jgi:acyl-CoA thioester hydrolase
MAKSDFKFCFPFRIRYAETDAQGIVFNAHYFTFFDTAIYEYFRQLPFGFVEYVRQTGHDFHTVHVTMDFIAPARFDDQIEVHVKTEKYGRSSLSFALEVYRTREDDPLVRGQVVWVNADQTENKSAPLPHELVEKLKNFENR